MVASEGIETVLSLKIVMPAVPMVAALSASHLGALVLPPGLERLYIACDADRAGQRACDRLAERARAGGITVLPLHPSHGDFNDDLRACGPSQLAVALRAQIAQEDLVHLDPNQPIRASGHERDGGRQRKTP
jgi:hypothetical protein